MNSKDIKELLTDASARMFDQHQIVSDHEIAQLQLIYTMECAYQLAKLNESNKMKSAYK